jgi:hypothetical protein
MGQFTPQQLPQQYAQNQLTAQAAQNQYVQNQLQNAMGQAANQYSQQSPLSFSTRGT